MRLSTYVRGRIPRKLTIWIQYTTQYSSFSRSGLDVSRPWKKNAREEISLALLFYVPVERRKPAYVTP